jgi:hypothetical protein
VAAKAYERGLACYPMGGTLDGRRGDHVLLAPPYNVTSAELHMIVERFGMRWKPCWADASECRFWRPTRALPPIWFSSRITRRAVRI